MKQSWKFPKGEAKKIGTSKTAGEKWEERRRINKEIRDFSDPCS